MIKPWPQRRLDYIFIVHLGKGQFLDRLLQEQAKKSVKIHEISHISLFCQKKYTLIKHLHAFENKRIGPRFLPPPRLYFPCSWLLISRGSLLVHVRVITVLGKHLSENYLYKPKRLWMQKYLATKYVNGLSQVKTICRVHKLI